MSDRDDLRHIRHMATNDRSKRVEEEDLWSIFAIVAVIATAILISLPFLDSTLGDGWMRFILMLGALIVLAVISLRMVLPKRSPYQEMDGREIAVPVPDDGDMGRALKGEHDDQLRQYRELQTALGHRIMTRRQNEIGPWREIRTDPGRCLSIVGDRDLTDLATADMMSVDNINRLKIYGLAFDDDFEARFEFLLKKVEDWR
jgi:hypothetical protein